MIRKIYRKRPRLLPLLKSDSLKSPPIHNISDNKLADCRGIVEARSILALLSERRSRAPTSTPRIFDRGHFRFIAKDIFKVQKCCFKPSCR